jgi:hypothetical protein
MRFTASLFAFTVVVLVGGIAYLIAIGAMHR